MMFLLGNISKKKYNGEQRYVLKILLLVAKKMITVYWKDEKSPTITQWVQRLQQVYIMEWMTASLQLTFSKMDNCLTISEC